MKKMLFGLVALTLAFTTIAGCQRPATVASKDKKDVKKEHGHDEHEHGPGPHDGVIIEFGKWHAEFTVDHKKHEAIVYILGEDAKTPVALAIEKPMLTIKSPMFQAEMKADPEKGDPEGKSSRYVAKHEHLGKEQEFEGTFSGVVDKTPYSGDFKEEKHEHKKK